ncbi:nicotinate-nucleotide--dimethylbenzimidazole phosphoribosyltransferase [Pseudomonas aeruginosa]|nr:nicotinate-nucleotide--dimethylbenzimidazole phosphoribosyltransferase [Pseudomonas aeruginosa]
MSLQWWRDTCREADPQMRRRAAERQDRLTKPRGSLGRLEQVAIDLAALQGRERPSLERIWVTVFAGDHGVVAEGISAYPQAVTGEMLRNFVRGGAAISVLARELGAGLEVVDLGTAFPLEALPGVRHLRLAAGTANFVEASAMGAEQCLLALEAGRESVRRAEQAGSQLFIGGEMGIGNTTAAAAMACALLDAPASALVGPGTGLDASGVAHKAAVVERALALHGAHRADPFETLRRLGGLEIAALAGAYLACAQKGMVALVDGYICSVAALCAVRLNPACRDLAAVRPQRCRAGPSPCARSPGGATAARPRPAPGRGQRRGAGGAAAAPGLRAARGDGDLRRSGGLGPPGMSLRLDLLRHGETESGGGFRGSLDDAFDRAWLGADAHGGGRRTLGPAGQLAIATLPRLRRGTGAAPGDRAGTGKRSARTAFRRLGGALGGRP